jgi:hypothetical protein
MPMQQWLDMGRNLAAQSRTITWLAGDWFNFGKATYGEQAMLDLPEFGGGVKKLKEAAKIAETFEPAHRDMSLGFDHYKHLSELPFGEARKLIERAKTESLSPSDIRTEALKTRVLLGQGPADMFGDDPDEQARIAIQRAYNMAPIAAKRAHYDLVCESAENGFRLIDG